MPNNKDEYHDSYGNQYRRMPGDSARPTDSVGRALDYQNQTGRSHPYVKVTGPKNWPPPNYKASNAYLGQREIPASVGPGGRMTKAFMTEGISGLRESYPNYANAWWLDEENDWMARQSPQTLKRLTELMESTLGRSPRHHRPSPGFKP